MSVNPSENNVVAALSELRKTQPSLGIAKVLVQLKKQNPGWALSEKRLKTIMSSSGLTAVDPSGPSKKQANMQVPLQLEHSPPRTMPRAHSKGWTVMEEASYEKVKPLQVFVLGKHLGKFNWTKLSGKKGYKLPSEDVEPHPGMSYELLHQLDYLANSDRCYRLYGRGEHDWGVTFNSDMNVFFSMMMKRVVTGVVPESALFTMYQRLLAAARQTDVSAEDLRAQLHAEYGIDPLTASANPPVSLEEAASRRAYEEEGKAKHRANQIQMLKALLAYKDGPPELEEYKVIEVDERGEPVYREEIHGLDAVFCIPVKRIEEDWRMK